MSEFQQYGPNEETVKHLESLRSGQRKEQEPDPIVEAIYALRSAVVAQTALLRSISEQVRLGFEDKTLKGSLDGFLQATAVWFEKTWKQQAGLAERLEKHGKMFSNIHDRLELYSGFPEALLQVKGHLAAIEAKLPPDKVHLLQPNCIPKEVWKALRYTKKPAAAQRKAKR